MWFSLRALLLLALLTLSCAESEERAPTPQKVGGDVLEEAGGALFSSPSDEKRRQEHMLASELARTLTELRGVRDARVHLNLADHSLAARRSEVKSQAAVLIIYGEERPPDKDEIRRLTTAAVPDLTAEKVEVFYSKHEEPKKRTVFVGPVAVADTSANTAKLLVGGLLGLCLLMAVGLIVAGYHLRRAREGRRRTRSKF